MKKPLLLVLLVAVGIIVSKLLVENVAGLSLDVLVGRWLADPGMTTAGLIVGLLAADVFLPIPSSVVMVLSGAAFGAGWGALLALVGSVGGEWLGFELVRRYGAGASPLA